MQRKIKPKQTHKPDLLGLLKINGREDLICSKCIIDFVKA